MRLFESSIAKILRIVLFLKIMLIIDLDDFLSLNFFSLLFDLLKNSRSTPVDPSHITPVCRSTQAENQ